MRTMPVSRNSNIDSKGVTLVEVMISLVILLVVFMGLIQASLLTIDHNMRNVVRDEAVQVASEYLAKTRSTDFAAILPDLGPCGPTSCDSSTAFAPFPSSATVTRNFRNRSIDYSIGRCVCDLNAGNKKVGIKVTWSYRGDNFEHLIYSTVGSGT
jgi:type IV pilus assembly protein PilV